MMMHRLRDLQCFGSKDELLEEMFGSHVTHLQALYVGRTLVPRPDALPHRSGSMRLRWLPQSELDQLGSHRSIVSVTASI